MKKVKKHRNIRRKPLRATLKAPGATPPRLWARDDGVTRIATDEEVRESNARERAALPAGVAEEIIALVVQQDEIERVTGDDLSPNHPSEIRLKELRGEHKVSDWLFRELLDQVDEQSGTGQN
jgi:hypothetical protein